MPTHSDPALTTPNCPTGREVTVPLTTTIPLLDSGDLHKEPRYRDGPPETAI